MIQRMALERIAQSMPQVRELLKEYDAMREVAVEAVMVMREEAECVKDNSGEGDKLNVSLFTAYFTLSDTADKLAKVAK